MRQLELGVNRRIDGWETLDVRPGGTYRGSAVDLSRFEDDTFHRVVTSDMIEHLSWRDVPAALREWLRVLHPDGELHIGTPNALELQWILMGRETPSHWNGEQRWEQFNRVAFGHQDYPENTHRSYWTSEWLEELLREAGAGEVWTIVYAIHWFQLGARK